MRSGSSSHQRREGRFEEVARLLGQLIKQPEIPASELAVHWKLLSEFEQPLPRRLYQKLAEVMRKQAWHMLAFDVSECGLRHWKRDRRLLQLKALALADCGVTKTSNEIAQTLYRDYPRDEETVGILARTHKDLWLALPDGADQQKHLQCAYKLYTEGYNAYRGYWLGINAATLALLQGELSSARRTAGRVKRQCERVLRSGIKQIKPDERYWLRATLGESYLILGDIAKAIQWYSDAQNLADRKFGFVTATYRQACLILRHLISKESLSETEAQTIKACFRLPHVIGFAGHMLDREGRVPPRFPRRSATRVYEVLLKKLEKLHQQGDVIGYSSAACGSDILFLEAVKKVRGEAYIVLPYAREQFMRDSVEFAGRTWVRRFNAVVDRAEQESRVFNVSPFQRLSWGSTSYDYANRVLTGLASLHASRLGRDPVGLAVWDGRQGDAEGGTCSIVRRWEDKLGWNVDKIDPTALLDKRELTRLPQERIGQRQVLRKHTVAEMRGWRIRAVLFADIERFSELSEEQMPAFVEHFVCMVGAISAVSPDRPLVQESRGDGMFFVFDDVGTAGRFALDLLERMNKTNWPDFELPKSFRARMALHAGPVYHYICPFTKTDSCTGQHVTQTARIEPIAPPGEIYASQIFAALASQSRVQEFVCEYAGLVPLAKKFGTTRVYHVRPNIESRGQ